MTERREPADTRTALAVTTPGYPTFNAPHLRSEGLALIVGLEALVVRIVGPFSGALYVQSWGCGCAEDATQPLLPADVMRRGSRFLDMLEKESGAEELIALTR